MAVHCRLYAFRYPANTTSVWSSNSLRQTNKKLSATPLNHESRT